MSFALRIHSAPRALHRRLPMALAMFALGASTFALVFAESEQRGTITLAALACLAVFLARRRLARGAGSADGSLSIDEAGRASWIDSRIGALASKPVRIERWSVFGPYAWLRLRAQEESTTIDVMFARGRSQGEAHRCVEGSDAGDDWRRLRAWLLWYGRGTLPADGRTRSGRARQ